jgi:GNAT superfamily N-acetyltransferase
VVTGPVALEDVDEAIAWVQERGLPYRVWIVEELLEGLGRSVGTSVAIQGGGASGVVAVGTLAEARRRGVGTALSWAAAEAGRQRGFDTVVLQASPMGLPVYEAMGFTTVVAYADFVASRT